MGVDKNIGQLVFTNENNYGILPTMKGVVGIWRKSNRGVRIYN